MDKIKMTKKDFDTFYEIEEIEKEASEPVKEKELDDFLSEEEQEIDNRYHEGYPQEKEE